MRVAIAGGSGFLGRRLTRRLLDEGHDVVWLSHRPGRSASLGFPGIAEAPFDPARPDLPWRAEVRRADAVANLSGHPIASRWNARVKQLIRTSRVATTAALAGVLAERADDGEPAVLVNASAVGVYGDAGETVLTEESPTGHDFLARLAMEWEAAAGPAAAAGARVVRIRTGVVLGEEGVLPRMTAAMRLFAGGPVGSGRQWLSWIHEDDIVGLYVHALTTPSLEGPLNAGAPDTLTMAEFASTLGRVMHRPSWLRVPLVALRVILGEVAPYTVMSQRMSAEKALASGYVFRFADAESALLDLIGRR